MVSWRISAPLISDDVSRFQSETATRPKASSDQCKSADGEVCAGIAKSALD